MLHARVHIEGIFSLLLPDKESQRCYKYGANVIIQTEFGYETQVNLMFGWKGS